MLTDLDNYDCPLRLIEDWLGQDKTANPNFIFRIAVREVEAWLMADRENLAHFLGIPLQYIPQESDSLIDAKATLINLAERSRKRELKSDLIPKKGSTAKQGSNYNGCLAQCLQTWRLEKAMRVLPSLARAHHHLSQFTP